MAFQCIAMYWNQTTCRVAGCLMANKFGPNQPFPHFHPLYPIFSFVIDFVSISSTFIHLIQLIGLIQIKAYNAIFLKSPGSHDTKTDIPSCQIHKYKNTNSQINKYSLSVSQSFTFDIPTLNSDPRDL